MGVAGLWPPLLRYSVFAEATAAASEPCLPFFALVASYALVFLGLYGVFRWALSQWPPQPVVLKKSKRGLLYSISVQFGGGPGPRRALTLEELEEWSNRLTSTVHALMATVGVLFWWFAEACGIGKSPGQYWWALGDRVTMDFNGIAQPALRNYVLGIVGGYILFDFFRILHFTHVQPLKSGAGGAAMLLHHLIVLATWSFGIYFDYGTFHMTCFAFNEATTPFLNARFFLKYLFPTPPAPTPPTRLPSPRRKTLATEAFPYPPPPALLARRPSLSSQLVHPDTIKTLNDVCFSVSFLVIRGVLNLILIIHLQRRMLSLYADGSLQAALGGREWVIWASPILAWGHVILNWVWCFKICRMVWWKVHGVEGKAMGAIGGEVDPDKVLERHGRRKKRA